MGELDIAARHRRRGLSDEELEDLREALRALGAMYRRLRDLESRHCGAIQPEFAPISEPEALQRCAERLQRLGPAVRLWIERGIEP